MDNFSISLEDELKNTKEELEKVKLEKDYLQKAIWDMLNYSTFYILLLDRDMNIRLINYQLATKLGFKNEDDPIGSCWINFIKPEERDVAKIIHESLSNDPSNVKKYKETLFHLVDLNGKSFFIKWFNVPINSKYNMVLSFGVERQISELTTEDSLRSYYSDILDKDKTMINALRDKIIGGLKIPPMCNIVE